MMACCRHRQGEKLALQDTFSAINPSYAATAPKRKLLSGHELLGGQIHVHAQAKLGIRNNIGVFQQASLKQISIVK